MILVFFDGFGMFCSVYFGGVVGYYMYIGVSKLDSEYLLKTRALAHSTQSWLLLGNLRKMLRFGIQTISM